MENVKIEYEGIVKETKYNYIVEGGYLSSLELICDNGEELKLGADKYDNFFSEMIGDRIKLTVEIIK